jgi:hypothetical protein
MTRRSPAPRGIHWRTAYRIAREFMEGRSTSALAFRNGITHDQVDACIRRWTRRRVW